MYHINCYHYVGRDKRAKVWLEIFARKQEFADKLIERLNKISDYKWRRKRFFFVKTILTPDEPYLVEQAQIEIVEKLEEDYAKNKEREQQN